MRSRQLLVPFLLATIAVIPLLSGCSQSPASVADRFIQAATNKKYIEAVGYVSFFESGDGGQGQEQAAQSLVSRVLPENPRTGYKLTEQSGSTAKVVLGRNSSGYMLLNKTGSKWLITEIGYVKKRTDKVTIPHETDSTDDASRWEGDDRVTQQGTDGEKEVEVVTPIINGEEQQEQRTDLRTLRQPVSESVARGTKLRSAGWKAIPYPGGDDIEVQVTEMREQSDGLKVSWQVQTQRPISVHLYLATGKPDSYGNIPVTQPGPASVDGDTWSVVVTSPSGGAPEKSAIILTCGLAYAEWDGSNPKLQPRENPILTGDKLYPGPVMN